MSDNNLETYTINQNQIKINFTNSVLNLTVLTSEIVRIFQNRGEHTKYYAFEGN